MPIRGTPVDEGDPAGASTIFLRRAVALISGFPALAGADLEVEPGEVLVVRGPNGAGKSTLLRLCAGLLPVASGQARVLGCDLSADRREVRRRIGLLDHGARLYDDLTAEENVVFQVRAARGDPAQCRPALERVGLAGRVAATRAGALSAGQRRRVALAGLVARSPRLWLLDEPHAGLDQASRAVVDEIVEEASGLGRTVVLVTHEPDVVTRTATRVATMAGGRIVAGAARGATQVSGTAAVPAEAEVAGVA